MKAQVCKRYLYCKAVKLLGHAHTPMHCVYLATVSIEAHGVYGIAAGGLLLVTIFGAISGDSE